MTDVPGPPAGNPGDLPPLGENPTDPTIVQPITAAGAPFNPAPGGPVPKEDQPWYRGPGGIAAGAAVLVVLLGLLLFALFGGSDDNDSVVSTDVEDSVQLEITRMTRTEEGVPATLTATVIGPVARPADYGWILPPGAQAPEPAVGSTDASGKLKFAWAPVATPTPETTWSSTITITEVLPANATLTATSYECVLNRGDVKSNITIFVNISTEPVTEPRNVVYSFSGVKFVPGDFATCPILSGDMNVEPTTTTTPETTTTTVAPTTTVPETTTTVAPTTTVPETTTTTVAPTPTTAPETSTTVLKTTVIDTIENDPDLTSFALLIDTVGLRDQLNDQNSTFTIMAPDNTAIDQLLAGPNPPDLTDPVVASDFVLAHVKTGMVLMSADLVDGETITFDVGDPQVIAVAGSAITVGGAPVVAADATSETGVVHTLGQTLIPPTP